MLTPDRFRISHTVFPNKNAPLAAPGDWFQVILLTPDGQDGSCVGPIHDTQAAADKFLRSTLKLVEEGLPVLPSHSIRSMFRQEQEGLFFMPRARTLEIARRMVKMPADLARAGFNKTIWLRQENDELGFQGTCYAYAFGK